MNHFRRVPLIGIIRDTDTGTAERAVAAAMAGGLKTLEITLNRPDAIDQIARIKGRFAREIELGAGTVLEGESAQKAIDAGAEFIVTPAVLPDVIEYCRDRAIPVFPGALSPTEVLNAYRAGAEMVKVFPIQSLGPAHIKSLKGPFPRIPLVPTGGITLESVTHYFQAGADALGVGGELFKRDWLARKDWASIEATARAYVQAVEEWR